MKDIVLAKKECTMGFSEDLLSMPFHIIEKAIFKDRRLTIVFKSGNSLTATCPDGNPQWEILQKEFLKNLPRHKVEIYDRGLRL